MNGTKIQYVVLMLIGLISSSVFAQSGPKPQQTEVKPKLAKSKSAPSPVIESAEHNFARQRYEKLAPLCLEDENKLAEIVKALHELNEKPMSATTRDDIDRSDSLIKDMRSYSVLKDKCNTSLERVKQQLEHADDCLSVYHKTIDKKTSDITTREAGQINDCKSLNLYPPEKE